jgi:hypothetical protein
MIKYPAKTNTQSHSKNGRQTQKPLMKPAQKVTIHVDEKDLQVQANTTVKDALKMA